MASLADIDIAVLCGGRGTRIAPVLGDIPKVLAPVSHSAAGPVLYLDWLFAKLKRYGAKRVILLAGVGAEQIAAHLAMHTPVLPVHIHIEARQQGTANAIRKAAHLLTSDPVMIVNGDTMTDAPLATFLDLHHNTAQFASQLYARPAMSSDDTSTSNAGFTLVPQWLLQSVVRQRDTDFDFALGKRVGHILTSCRFLDIGTPDRLAHAPVFFDQIVPVPE